MSDTPLAERLRLRIEASGPMTLADYMAACLGDPVHGYYMTRDPFGVAGDFTTAPEISQMFGEIVGAWLVEMWRLAGRPSPVRLVELGPGRGTLMADILRVAARVPELAEAASIHLVETSPVLRVLQQQTLAASHVRPSWHSSFADVDEGPLLMVANEFFDALPIRQFVRSGDAWRERLVGLDAEGNLAFGLSAAPLEIGIAAAEGSVLEVRPAGETLVGAIAERIAKWGGGALIIDYGHVETSFGDTLQALHGHRYSDPLAAPGEADLTAHVDFAALLRHATGVAIHGPIAQRDFLLPLGLTERGERLGAQADPPTRAKLHAAVDRLSGADQMGTLFKVMALTRRGVAPLPFAAHVSS